MSAVFTVAGYSATMLLDVRIEGLLEADDMARLREALIAEIRRLPCAAGEHRSLYDITACKIQPQQVVGQLRELSARRGQVARRLALVVGGSLMRMQLKRIIGEERVARLFDDRETALAWVLGDD